MAIASFLVDTSGQHRSLGTLTILDFTHSFLAQRQTGKGRRYISLTTSTQIDRFVELAKKDECFNYVLGGVWHVTGMKDDVFAQIEEVRKQDWSWT